MYFAPLSRFVCSICYFGLSLHVGQLSGDVFVNFCLSAVFEIAAYVAVIFCLEKYGRKTIYCFSLLVAAVALISTIFPVLYMDQGSCFDYIRSEIGVGSFRVFTRR